MLDVCVDYTGADGVRDMTEVVSPTGGAVDDPARDRLHGARRRSRPPSQWIGGRAVLNSVNLEDGDAPGTRLDRFLTLAKQYGAAVICTCIDTEGQARTADWKVRAAKAIHDLAVDRYGLGASGPPVRSPRPAPFDRHGGVTADGIETIEAIRRIKTELPGTHTVLGLSNVSFGLAPAARQVLNSVFLHECVQAGLDAAIVHAGKILPLHRIGEQAREICTDLVYDRRREGYDPLAALMSAFEGAANAGTAREDRSGWPRRATARAAHRRRRPQRPRAGARRGTGRRPRRSRHSQRHAAAGDENRRRALRLRSDAAAVRPAIGRDDEGGGRLPRAPHGEAPRRRRPGSDRARRR